ncbi:MAG: alpha/beta hydrolase [Deltaproteobacteria bacterium]|nr:alpha/beta hydrolase [Deltaproteobacteria bacterium]
MKQKFRRRMALALGALVGAWLLGSGLLGYVVTRPNPGDPETPAGAVAVWIPSQDGVRVRAWRFAAPGAWGTVVVGHGYRCDRSQLAMVAPHLARRGLRTVTFDFRGHGATEGHADRITFGAREHRDVAPVLAWARALPGPVGYLGFSMGAAGYVLSGVEADAAVLDSPFDVLSHALSARLWSLYVPPVLGLPGMAVVSLRAGESVWGVAPVRRAGALRRPTLFVFAGHDHWVSRASQDAWRRSLAPGSLVQDYPDLGHGDHFTGAWMARVTSFLAEAL